MVSTKIDYEGRLPYAWAWDPETRTEYLLHRGYKAIAKRPADEPMAAEFLPGVRHPEHDWKGWFYSDGNSASRDAEMKARCERILARFLTGYDVRGLIDPGIGVPKSDGTRKPPVTKGKYVDRTGQRKINSFGGYDTAEDVLRERIENLG